MTADGTVLKRRTLLAMAVWVIGLAGSARASLGPELVDLNVVDRETGQTLPVWRHDGRLFVAGQPGGRYSLRVTNHTGGRVLVVMSVDGVNVLTGQTAGYGQSGYVFRPYESYDVSGWRKSDTEVAAFTFTPQANSYAARTGRPQDIGVIGIAAFSGTRAVHRASCDSGRRSPRRASRARSATTGRHRPIRPLPSGPSAAALAGPAGGTQDRRAETAWRIGGKPFRGGGRRAQGRKAGHRPWRAGMVGGYHRTL